MGDKIMAKITEYNFDTGESIERDLTAEELKRFQADKDEVAKDKQAEIHKLAAKQSAQAKLAALGLTEEEVASILG
jgi:hypothetical protein